jgi:hypothetical protein
MIRAFINALIIGGRAFLARGIAFLLEFHRPAKNLSPRRLNCIDFRPLTFAFGVESRRAFRRRLAQPQC